MDELIKQLSSPIWWVSVIVAGFLVNLFAAYAKPIIDKIVSRYSKARRDRVEDHKRRLDGTIDYLLDNPSEVMDLKLDVITTIMQIILSSAFAIFVTQLLDMLMKLGYFHWEIGTLLKIIIYLIFSVRIIMSVRKYFLLKRILNAYLHVVHTVESRFLNGDFPKHNA